MSYLYLITAILLEVVGTTSMKLAEGFSKLIPSVLVFVTYGLSLAALVLALKGIQLSFAYAIWSGLGTALIAAIAFVWFNEPMSALKVASIALIVLGVIGLNASGEVS